MSQTINVEATPGLFMPTLHFSQDDIGREFTINVVSHDDFHIPVGATVTCQGTKPSGMGFVAPCTFSGDVVTLVATDTDTECFTDENGIFEVELHIVYGGDIIGTANFYMDSEPNPHPDGTIDGKTESILPALTVMVNEITDAYTSMHTLSVSATTLSPGSSATAVYDPDTNSVTFGIPRGAQLSATDTNADGNIVISFN